MQERLTRLRWILFNKSLQGEVKEILVAIKVFEERDVDASEITFIKNAWAIHRQHLVANQSFKNEKILPLMAQRINMPSRKDSLSSLLEQLDQSVSRLQLPLGAEVANLHQGLRYYQERKEKQATRVI